MVLACADIMCWHGKVGSGRDASARQPAGATGPRPAPLRFRPVSGGTRAAQPPETGRRATLAPTVEGKIRWREAARGTLEARHGPFTRGYPRPRRGRGEPRRS